mmetsp:Transcript_95821/g.273234  ORF Transcript_95821/g.273234 Transcript_95821/m.273234 type:complete len:100 (+) Transcript_95821:87-386(+)
MPALPRAGSSALALVLALVAPFSTGAGVAVADVAERQGIDDAVTTLHSSLKPPRLDEAYAAPRGERATGNLTSTRKLKAAPMEKVGSKPLPYGLIRLLR